jgi:acetate---CoA ligase (ADP-forming)
MSNALEALLRPRTIAVIGASRTAETIGTQILSNLVRHGFTGAVYPVNPHATAIGAIRAYPDVASIPDPVDMAVIVVPATHVVDVARQCGRAGVRAIVVISAGFRELGDAGRAREQELLGVVREYDMRMIGPNCMGALNTDPAVSMNATFAPQMPPHGGAAFVSQSGAVGANVLDYAREYGLGIAQFVSVGNKADISGNDLLEQWEHDPSVGLILMYVESFGNPTNFLAIARRITRTKPIIAVKSGRSAVGARAATSHTGAMAASDDAVDALIAQAGVIRASSIEEMFDIAMAFTDRPFPRTRATAVLTNAGGPGILASDALEMHGLDVVELQPETVERLRPLFPAEASLRNPLDMIASANPAGYRVALEALLLDPGIASVVAIFVPPLGVRQEEIAEAIGDVASRHRDKPVIAVLMGRDGLPQGRAELHRMDVPAYIFPESAARALGALCRYRERRDQPASLHPWLVVDRDRADAAIARLRRSDAVAQLDVLDLVESYGIATARAEIARSADEAAAIAARFGFPVVMKIVAPELTHKSDVGGVRTGINGAAEARDAYGALLDAVRRAAPRVVAQGVLVQSMVSGGRETIVGMTRDPSFGPIVMFGLGGVFVEVLRDVVVRIAPIGTADACEMIHGIRGARILEGFRGEPAADSVALIDAILRISQLAIDYPEIEEIEINPLLARCDGVVALDARARLRGGDAEP